MFGEKQWFQSKRLAVAGICAAMALPIWGQVRKLHTRDLTRLSQVQVADYLKRNDTVFVPIGAVETNGIMPSDDGYVSPLGYAMAMAEETDSLWMPGLPWNYPGGTLIAPASVTLEPTQATEFLKQTAKSLLRQGFRRQIFISAGQGPAPMTGAVLAREFYDTMRVPILYINMNTYLPRLKLPASGTNRLLYGCHYIAGRIIDIPLAGDYGPAESTYTPPPPDEGLDDLNKLGYGGSLSLGYWQPDVMSHGGRGSNLPKTETEREEWGKQGAEQVRSIVRQMNLKQALADLKKHDDYTNKVLVPKYGKILLDSSDLR
jgi:creatinine amidohydrolase